MVEPNGTKGVYSGGPWNGGGIPATAHIPATMGVHINRAQKGFRSSPCGCRPPVTSQMASGEGAEQSLRHYLF